MKQLLAASCLATAIATAPVSAGSLDDPVVEADLVIAEAERDSAKEDGLIVMVALMLLAATAGGAF
ncbi:hypothetical protein [Roseovarius sp. 2305UL8-3]|uniref:hypothetical protein n=1 Tax=Roseovarius conchicola TaxID=3121636 RepID=UPI0035281E80